jgi:hypothetical protein
MMEDGYRKQRVDNLIDSTRLRLTSRFCNPISTAIDRALSQFLFLNALKIVVAEKTKNVTSAVVGGEKTEQCLYKNFCRP